MLQDTNLFDDLEMLSADDSTESFSFGMYLRSVRRAKGIKLRPLAKAVNKTPTYISDIETGNNKPPDKPLLDLIIFELHIESYPRIINKLYDLAARERGDIPADIKDYVMENTQIITAIRNIMSKTNSEDIWKQIANM